MGQENNHDKAIPIGIIYKSLAGFLILVIINFALPYIIKQDDVIAEETNRRIAAIESSMVRLENTLTSSAGKVLIIDNLETRVTRIENILFSPQSTNKGGGRGD